MRRGSAAERILSEKFGQNKSLYSDRLAGVQAFCMPSFFQRRNQALAAAAKLSQS